MRDKINPIIFDRKKKKIVLIDQSQLPLRLVYLKCEDYREVAQAIKEMKIRGAPAIGIAAALGIALGIKKSKANTLSDLKKEFNKISEIMLKTRPTAANLSWAVQRMKKKFQKIEGLYSPSHLKEALIDEALKIYWEDKEICQKIGKWGAELMEDGDGILTYCNAGGLATSGFGTAIGVIRYAHKIGKKIKVFACETRPFLQGARLTAWELKELKIPTTVICDNMAGYFIKKGEINKVIVGADRITKCGDTANKIGTYSLAILSYMHKIPFYVAAPLSTFDFNLKKGEDIPIEQRSEEEVARIGKIRIVPPGVKVAHPAFDVTPAKYISAIITEYGIIKKPYSVNIKRLKE